MRLLIHAGIKANPYYIQYVPRNMHTLFALLCFVVVIHWLIFPYPSGLLHWHCGNPTIAPVPAKQPWWIWINTSCEFIMNDCITTTKQSTTKPCAYFLGYTVKKANDGPDHIEGKLVPRQSPQGPSIMNPKISPWLTESVIQQYDDYDIHYIRTMYIYTYIYIYYVKTTTFTCFPISSWYL